MSLRKTTMPEINSGVIPDPPDILHPRSFEFDLPADEASELTMFSLGYGVSDSAQMQGISLDEVNRRRTGAKEHLGARNRRQMTALAIQNRVVPIKVKPKPSLKPLSTGQDALLRLIALGWTSSEIQAKFGITESSVDARLVLCEQKLEATGVNHAVRIYFEEGIFKIGEPILGPDAAKDARNGYLRVAVENKVLSAQEIGLNTPGELEIVRILGSLGVGYFDGSTMYQNGFAPKASNPHARANLYRSAAMRLEGKLNQAFGETILASHGTSRNHRYFFIVRELAIGTPENMRAIAPASIDSLPKRGNMIDPADRPKPVRRKVAKKKVPKKDSVRPIVAVKIALKQMEQATVDMIESIPVVVKSPYLDQESLPDLDDDLLKNLVPRSETDLSSYRGVLAALNEVMQSKQAPFDYRVRMVASLRFGVPIRQPVIVSRREQSMKLDEIMQFVPSQRGIDTNSTSLITGLSPTAVLETELAFLQKHRQLFPNLIPLINIVAKELVDLRKQTSSN